MSLSWRIVALGELLESLPLPLPFFLLGLPPRLWDIAPIFFIIFCISENCLTRRLTSATCVPLPSAMRERREPLIISGRARSSGVIERMMASVTVT